MSQAPDSVEQLRAEGYAVVIYNPDELRGVSTDGIEEHMITKGNEYIDLNSPEPDDEEGICPGCDGSGEGMYDGTRCMTCHGRGES